jgi:hypothetical protein
MTAKEGQQMATATLKGAMSFFHDGVKYLQDEVTEVQDATAKELAEFDGYFQVKFGDSKPASDDKPAKGVKVVKKGADAVQSIAQADEETAAI